MSCLLFLAVKVKIYRKTTIKVKFSPNHLVCKIFLGIEKQRKNAYSSQSGIKPGQRGHIGSLATKLNTKLSLDDNCLSLNLPNHY